MKNFYLIVTLFILAVGGMKAQTPNWASDIAPILYQNCTACHHSGGLAPFSLMTFGDATNYATDIKDAVENKRMPPWPPNPDYNHLAFERILSSAQIQTISDWVVNGAPQGNPNDAPAAPVYSNTPTITTPDVTATIPTYTSTATTSDEYRCFVVPSGTSIAQYITDIEVIPGNPQIVHHVLIFEDSTTKPAQLDNQDPGPGWSSFGGTGSNESHLIGAWVPGQGVIHYPSGFGVRMAGNTNIVIQVHYPAGSAGQTDDTQVRLKLTTGPVRQLWINPILNHSTTLLNGPLYILPNTTKTFFAEYTVPINVSVFNVGPHMHLIGKGIKVYGVDAPDTIPIIHIPNWDFHWQGSYPFKKLLKIPSGSVLRSEAFYDNTTNNPSNPNNPPKLVTLGEATTDEMMLVYFTYTYYLPGDENIVIDNTPNVGITNPIQDILFSVFPNPSKDKITLSFPSSLTKAMLSVYDNKGNEVMRQEVKPYETVSVNKWASGAYMLILQDENHYGLQKFIKE